MIRWRPNTKNLTTESKVGHREKKGRHIFVTGVSHSYLCVLCALCVKSLSAGIAPANTRVLPVALTPLTL